MLRLAMICLFSLTCTACTCYTPPTPQERLRRHQEEVRQQNEIRRRWGLPAFVAETKLRDLVVINFTVEVDGEEPRSVQMNSDDVDIDVNPDGGFDSFIFDQKVCFSKQAWEKGKIRCYDLVTHRPIKMDVSGIER